jgi:hypothetical protein
VPRLVIPDEFKKLVESKPAPLAGAIAKCVDKLGRNPRSPGLQTHIVRGTRDPKVFEAYVDRKNRVTWHWGEAGEIVLLNNCNHDILSHPYG